MPLSCLAITSKAKSKQYSEIKQCMASNRQNRYYNTTAVTMNPLGIAEWETLSYTVAAPVVGNVTSKGHTSVLS